MRPRIDVEPQAIEQLDALDAWWREHRPDSRTSVLDEFERALEALREQPEAGARYQRCGVRNVRRVRLHGTPYLLYYHFEPGGEVLSVVAVWSGMLGFGPAMGRR